MSNIYIYIYIWTGAINIIIYITKKLPPFNRTYKISYQIYLKKNSLYMHWWWLSSTTRMFISMKREISFVSVSVTHVISCAHQTHIHREVLVQRRVALYLWQLHMCNWLTILLHVIAGMWCVWIKNTVTTRNKCNWYCWHLYTMTFIVVQWIWYLLLCFLKSYI